jgi:hypothetical protein
MFDETPDEGGRQAETPEEGGRQAESPEPGYPAGETQPYGEGGPSADQATPPIGEEGEHGQTTEPALADDVGVPDDPGSGPGE